MDSMSTVETETTDGNSVMKAINVFLVAIGVTTTTIAPEAVRVRLLFLLKLVYINVIGAPANWFHRLCGSCVTQHETAKSGMYTIVPVHSVIQSLRYMHNYIAFI